MKILTSLAENNYFIGLAALINSVIKNGQYIDKIVVGYRGSLPSWLPELSKSKNGQSCILKNGLPIEFVLLENNLHMVHEKPKWFKYVTEVLEPEAEEYFFFDSDIVILKRMSFFGEWVKQGVALCEDVNYDMSSRHPIRLQWKKLAEKENIFTNKNVERYYNSGFLGWTKETSGFITDWDRCFYVLAKQSGDMKKIRVHDRSHVVLSANQDSLNLAVMTTNAPISTMGCEAMGFQHGLALMAHPIGDKPWSRKYIPEFFRGYAPRVSDIHFWENALSEELKPVSAFKVKYKLLLCKVLRGGARFYKKL